ncbi:autotransporter assembly complex protein TamA [Amaricoccus macauensis]|uniref:autotransporter assembly complex protein TamA n=1 Tax=Amaricoccus macauensis TaxID=57001 RepID=UPI003C7B5DA9
MAASFLHPVAPAHAFELFGIQLWGEDEEETGKIDIPDPLNYSVTIVAPDDVRGTIESASSLWDKREEPVAGKAGLLSRSRGDYRRVLGALYSDGYFGAGVSIQANGAEVADLTLAADIPDNSQVVISVEPGPVFSFGETEIVNAPPLVREDNSVFEPPSSVGFETGEDARLSAINSASSLTIGQWRQLSYAKAQEAGREVVADHSTSQLDVSVTLDPGPKVVYGPVSNRGSERVDPEFINYMIDLPQGGEYDPDDISDARDRLSNLGVFDSIRLVEAETLGPDGQMPINAVLKDRKRRGLGFGGTYSTIDGLGLSAYWLHRNLFGKAERLRFDASIEGLIAESDWKNYDYNAGVTFTKPGVLTPDTKLVTSLVANQSDYDTYRETSLTAQGGFSHEFSRNLSGELYGQFKRARYEDDFGTRDFLTFGLIGRGTYDRRDNEFDPTRGFYLQAELLPYHEFEYGNTAVRGTFEGRVYRGFGEDKNLVLAGRAKIGSFVGASIAESPPDMLFFSGGGGSVRGYAYNSIGVDGTDDDGDDIVTGGRSLAEASFETRYRFGDSSFGAVGFVDAGLVNSGSDFTDTGDVRVGVGLGARYYTSFGPLRVDAAVPLDKKEGDDSFGIYIGIGQAF